MAPVHTLSDKLEITVANALEPQIHVRRTDTLTLMILKEDAWEALFRFAGNITNFLKNTGRRFHLWLPIPNERVKLECFKNSSGDKIVDLRQYERGAEANYFLLYSTSRGFSLNQKDWDMLLTLKPLLDRELVNKKAARVHMKELLVRQLTNIIFEITDNCPNADCKKKLAHSQDCSKTGTNWENRVELSLAEAMPMIDRSAILDQFRSEFGYEEDENLLLTYIGNDTQELKNALLFGY